MLTFSRAEVASAIQYLCRGGHDGGPLSHAELMWELQSGVGFGCCLNLAAANPTIFPAVLDAPFMKRELVRVQNVIVEDGRSYTMAAGNSCDASGAPSGFYYGWRFPAASLAE